MELFDMMKNIRGNDIEQELNNAIIYVKNALKGLTEERMCKIYSGYLHEELQKRHIPARIINTFELGVDYEHFFILVPSENEKYFLADLTFSQFKPQKGNFDTLLEKGYQSINDSLFNEYLRIISCNQSMDNVFLDDAFYLVDQNKKR